MPPSRSSSRARRPAARRSSRARPRTTTSLSSWERRPRTSTPRSRTSRTPRTRPIRQNRTPRRPSRTPPRPTTRPTGEGRNGEGTGRGGGRRLQGGDRGRLCQSLRVGTRRAVRGRERQRPGRGRQAAAREHLHDLQGLARRRLGGEGRGGTGVRAGTSAPGWAQAGRAPRVTITKYRRPHLR